MPIVAYAFHGPIAIEKLKRYQSPGVVTNSETRIGFCTKCSRTFALLLVNSTDLKNPRYVDKITRLIEEDCAGGKHRDEYVLSVEPVVEL
jgi:hypothetical protein